MGDLVDLNPVQSIIKNLITALLLAYSWNSPELFKLPCKGAFAAVISIVSSVTVFCMTPPDMYFRRGRVSDDLSEERLLPIADSLGLSDGKRVLCFYSATCEHCRHSASKVSGIITRNGLSEDSFHVLFMQTSSAQDSVSAAFFNVYGSGLELPYSYLHPYTFLPLTNGSMPLVVLYEDGRKVKEYDYLSIDEKEMVSFFSVPSL